MSAASTTSASGALIGSGWLDKFAAQKFAQAGVANGIARQRISRHAADRQLVDGVAALAPGQHLHDALDRHMRAGREIIAPQRVQQILVAGEGQRRVQLLLFLGEGIAA